MQVAQVNSSVATALGQSPAEDSSSRADDFARVLKSAFYGKGSEAVANTTERTLSETAPRTETRRDPRPEASRPVERVSYERAERVETRRSDDAAPRRETPAREAAPADRPAADRPAAEKAPAKSDTSATPRAREAAPTDETAAGTDTAAPQDTAQPAEQTAAAGDQVAEPAEGELAEDVAKPVVAEAPDALLILSLLQTQVMPAAMPVAETPVATAAPVAADTAPAVPAVSPLDAAVAALAAATETMQGETPAPVQTEGAAKPAAPVVAAPQPVVTETVALAQAAASTDTSAAALLSQQQTVTPEDLAMIQQALAAQSDLQAQAETPVQMQAQTGKPAVAIDTAPKAEPKTDKTLTVDVQGAAAPVAPKTLVDQASLFAMQGDEDQAAADAALLQQQQQQAQAAQPQVAAELKFNAALLQANAEAQLQGNAAVANTTGQNGNTHTVAMSSTGTPVVQAAQHAATQTTTRHLNAYIPADEQVALQIKKGVSEGVDKISIKLDPGNLGKVEIKLEVTHDGRLTAVIAADKPETLHMLQHEAGKLEQSLRDAGLKTDQQSLSFTLRDQGQANEGRDGNGAGGGRQRNRGDEDYAEAGQRPDPAQLAASNAQRAAAARGGLDIRI